jgi:hypothetical protein
MRVIVWNMAGAFPLAGTAASDAWNVLMSLQPDVALLQECRPPIDVAGHLHYMPTPYGWGTAVWSRWTLSNCSAFPSQIGDVWSQYRNALDGYVATASIAVPGSTSLTAVSVHAYAEGVADQHLAGFDKETLRLPYSKVIWPVDLISWALREHTATLAPAIVAGDWNTARLLDESYGRGGNHEFFERMHQAGWHEIARRFYPTETQTFFKRGGGPYQLDHAFVTAEIASATTKFEIVSSDAILAVSDHAALVMDVGPVPVKTSPVIPHE